MLGEWDARDTFHKKHHDPRGPSHRSYSTRVPLGKRHARHPPRHGPHDQGRYSAATRRSGATSCTAKAGWDTSRTARGTGRRRRSSASPRKTSARKISIEEYNRTCREGDGVHGQVGGPHAQDGLLGQHGRPVHHLRQQIHRETLWWLLKQLFDKGLLYKGLHHPALLARRRNGSLDPRTEPARLLPRRRTRPARRSS